MHLTQMMYVTCTCDWQQNLTNARFVAFSTQKSIATHHRRRKTSKNCVVSPGEIWALEQSFVDRIWLECYTPINALFSWSDLPLCSTQIYWLRGKRGLEKYNHIQCNTHSVFALTLANMMSTSVLVSFLSSNLQSLVILANFALSIWGEASLAWSLLPNEQKDRKTSPRVLGAAAILQYRIKIVWLNLLPVEYMACC